MMKGDSLYPKGFHPQWQSMLPDVQRSAKPLRRRDARPVKYYFIDFGISTKFEELDTNRLVSGFDGRDRELPELYERIRYDPFSADVFILGNVYRRMFVEVRDKKKHRRPS